MLAHARQRVRALRHQVRHATARGARAGAGARAREGRSDIAVLKAERAHLARPSDRAAGARPRAWRPSASSQYLRPTSESAPVPRVRPDPPLRVTASDAARSSRCRRAAAHRRGPTARTAPHPPDVRCAPLIATAFVLLGVCARSPSSSCGLPLKAAPEIRVDLSRAAGAQLVARPDIVDRHGRLLATDVGRELAVRRPAAHPRHRRGGREARRVLPGSRRGRAAQGARRPQPALRLGGARPDARGRRSRARSGLPGLAFRTRAASAPIRWAAGRPCPRHRQHRQQGLAGIERILDESGSASSRCRAPTPRRPPVRLSLDIGVQHALAAGARRRASTVRGRGGGRRSCSMSARARSWRRCRCPRSIPASPRSCSIRPRSTSLPAGTYELGSIFKIADRRHGARERHRPPRYRSTTCAQPLTSGRYTIKDLHPQGRPLTVREIFLHSSNVGAGMLALEAGAERQRAFLAKLGLLDADAHRSGPGGAAAAAEALGRDRDHHHRLRPRLGRGAAAVRRGGRGPRQRRRAR